MYAYSIFDASHMPLGYCNFSHAKFDIVFWLEIRKLTGAVQTSSCYYWSANITFD